MNGHELRNLLAMHEVLSRAYLDDRFPTPQPYNVRAFAITAVWVVGIERTGKGDRIERVKELLGLSDYAFREIIAADAPRWEPPPSLTPWARHPCAAPMIRRSGPCGKAATGQVRVTDPATGMWRIDWYCTRHEDARRVAIDHEKALQAAGGIPEPFPNTGGLLPCYIRWNWPEQYAWARRGWTPPSVGICADDWPAMTKVVAAERPRFEVLAGERTDDRPPQGVTPTLRLVGAEP